MVSATTMHNRFRITDQTMATSANVSPTELATALQTLTQDEAKEVFYYLKVPLHSLKSVSTHQSVSMCKIEYIQLWIDGDLDASWEKIVAGLERIGKKALADRLALLNCGRSLSGVEKTSLFPPPLPPRHPLPPPATTAMEGWKPANDVSSTPLHPTSASPFPPPHQNNPLPPDSLIPSSKRVSEVRADIDRLSETFSDLMSKTRDELCVRENNDPAYLDYFRDRLLDLPLAKKVPHDRFFVKSEDDLLMAKNVRKIFAILRRYCNYSNYDVLQAVIRKFCEALMQTRMTEYTVSLETFEKSTTIDVYLKAESAGPILSEEFKKMAVTINKPPHECTLYEVRKLKEEIAEEASLHSYGAYICRISKSSVKVVLGVHLQCVGKVLAVLDRRFLTTHCISQVRMGQRILVEGKSSTELNMRLMSASQGDVFKCASYLNRGAYINFLDENMRSPLFVASQNGDLQLVHLFGGRGANIDARNKNGLTPLIIAALKGRGKVVAELLSLGADANSLDIDWDSALIVASKWGYYDIVVELIKAGANLNQQNKLGFSALIWAASYGRSKVVEELIKAEAHLDLQNKKGKTALFRAAERGEAGVVVKLAKAGANLDIQNEDGDSAVIIAVTEFRSEVLKVLVRARSNLNLQNKEGLTALMIACRSERFDLANALLEEKDIDLNIQQNDTGWSALFFAAERGDATTTQALIQTGANPNLQDRNGLTALDIAMASDWDTDEVCQILTEVTITSHACHPDSPTPDQDTASSSSAQDSSTNRQDVAVTQKDTDQDTTLLVQESSTIRRRDEVVTRRDILNTEPLSSDGLRRQRPNISKALKNLVNRSRKMAVEIFNSLDRRLKSADRKEEISEEY